MAVMTPEIRLENGNSYTIRRNRIILCEIDKVRANKILNAEENKEFALIQDMGEKLNRIAKRVEELEAQYYESFDDEVGKIYEKAKAEYEKILTKTVELSSSGVIEKIQNETTNKMEKVIIESIRYDVDGDEIRTEEEAKEIWLQYKAEVGNTIADEWLVYAFNYLAGSEGEEDVDPFVKMQKEKREKKALLKAGISKVK